MWWIPIACAAALALLVIGGTKGTYGGEPGQIDTAGDRVAAAVGVILVTVALFAIVGYPV